MIITAALEEWIGHMAAGDAAKMARFKEICGWFPDMDTLHDAAIGITVLATEAERARMLGDGAPPIKILHWAMMEAESPDPRQRRRWAAYRSRVSSPPNPAEFVVGAVMVILVPGLVEQRMPGMGGIAVPAPRRGRGVRPIQMSRRSPRFPRRSARIRALARGSGGQ
ncbi:hypothetical protein CFC21_068915 [Triticum aestivum]|uniref:Uncharacterized protein n=2 Tax=Triticum aestivum TaxID=4565 RepID=A0A9R1HBB3_WHEAT|nr:hypothetical protein CFC21_068915 [Triticum aestivum]